MITDPDDLPDARDLAEDEADRNREQRRTTPTTPTTRQQILDRIQAIRTNQPEKTDE